MDLTKIDNLSFADVNYSDHPDYVDAYCSSADYNGIEMTEDQLDELNDKHWDFVYEKLMESLC